MLLRRKGIGTSSAVRGHTHAMRPDDAPRPVYRTNAIVGGDADAPRTLVEVLVVWGDDEVVLASYLEPGERFTLAARGDGRLAFAHPDHAGPALTLVAHDGERAVLHDPARGDVALPPIEMVEARVGEFTFRARRVARSGRLPARRPDRLLGVMLPVAFACAALTAGVTRRVKPGVTVDDQDAARRYLVALLHRNTARALPPSLPDPDGAPMGGTGARASGDEGAAGIRSAPQAQRRWREAPRRGPAVEERIVRPAAGASELASVQQRGIFAALGRVGLAPGALMLPGAHEETRATGNLYGADAGDAFGYAGLGLVGTGWGGGGHAADLVGLGRIQVRGRGDADGAGQGLGYGVACGCGGAALRGTGTLRSGVARFGARLGSGPTVCGVSPEEWARGVRCAPGSGEGLLDPAAIRRVVLRNRGQVERCYERALEVNAGAAGRVTVRWVIGPDGAVLGAGVADDDTGVASLGDCVATAARRWLFPAPEGGVVTVNYPFTFQRAE